MKVISIDPNEKAKQRHKADLLEVLNEMRDQIESGEIVSFVAASVCDDGECQIHAQVTELINGIGLFELGKQMLIRQEAFEE
jgi:hypothetical protein